MPMINSSKGMALPSVLLKQLKSWSLRSPFLVCVEREEDLELVLGDPVNSLIAVFQVAVDEVQELDLVPGDF